MLPGHGATEVQRVRRHRAVRGSREGTSPEPSQGPKDALLAVYRSQHQPAAHTGQDARSAKIKKKHVNFSHRYLRIGQNI